MTTWREIRSAAQQARLDPKEWQDGMHERLLTAILTRTGSVEQYMLDAAFHQQMDLLLAIVLATVFEHDPLSEDLRGRADDLGAAFRTGAEDLRGGTHRRA